MPRPALPPGPLVAPACPLALAPVLPAVDEAILEELLLQAEGAQAMPRHRAKNLTVARQAKG